MAFDAATFGRLSHYGAVLKNWVGNRARQHCTVWVGVSCTVGLACVHPHAFPPVPVQYTEASITRLSKAIGKYIDRYEDTPSDLDALCSQFLPCQGADRSQLEDAWGRRLLYVRLSSSDYELRSMGADGLRGTDDDLVYSPGVEARRVRELTGCYRVEGELTWFPQPRRMFLDSTHISTRTYDARPRIRPFGGPFWHPHGRDSLTVYWTGSESSGPVLRMLVTGNELVGSAFPPGMSARTDVRALREPCD